MWLHGPTPLLFGASRVQLRRSESCGCVEKKLITKAYQTFLMYAGWARVSLLQSHLLSKLAPTLLKTQTSMSKEVLVTTAGSQASCLYVYYIYTSWGDKGALPTARFCRMIVHAALSGCNITLPTDSYLCQWPRSYRQHSATSLHIPWL